MLTRLQGVALSENSRQSTTILPKRNESFRNYPKRAGGKIGEFKSVSNEFREGNNCKDPLYR
jgi:hypothetical protein